MPEPVCNRLWIAQGYVGVTILADNEAPDFKELSPAGMFPTTQSLQQRRSAETKLLILEAAIDCLAEVGYSDMTTQIIAKRAAISRGAMLHHYATKQDLIAATIDYAFFRHIEDFSAAVRSLSDEERKNRNVGISIDWQSYNTREFKAYLELSNAARTDNDLRGLFNEKARRHDQFWRQELIENFPEWAKDLDKLDKARRLTQALMTGLVINQDAWNEPATVEMLLEFLAKLLIDIREDRIAFPKM